MAALDVSELIVRYRDREEVHALGPVSFKVERGTFCCILGPTGCGKTTLLRTIAGLQKPDSGSVTVSSDASVTPSRIGYVFQQGALFPWMSVRKNIEFPLRAMGLDSRSRSSEVDSVLEMVGLIEFGSSYPHQLSGGMQQRAALARSLVTKPDILLLDEPLSSLDTRTSQDLQESLRAIWARASTTVLFVTHSIEEAVYLSGKVIVLGHRPGRIVRRQLIQLPSQRSRLSEEFTDYLISLRKTFEELVEEDPQG